MASKAWTYWREGPSNLHGESMVEGVSNSSLDFDLCENCIYGKQNRVSFPSSGKRKKHILELVHSDVFGPVKVPSLGNFVYYVSFIDDFSRNIWIYFLNKKFEGFDRFKEFKALVENQTEKKIKVLRNLIQNNLIHFIFSYLHGESHLMPCPLPIFCTTRGSVAVFPAHLFISSCNPFITLLSHNNFMQVSRKLISIEGSIS